MEDYLVRGVGEDGKFRVFAATTTHLVEEARKRHDTWPVASAALGRSLTAGLLLGANLKGEDLITLRIFGDGPLGAIIVTANAAGEARGYVQEPHTDLAHAAGGKLPVGAAVGKGVLYVTKDLGLKEPFTGSVELVSGEIGEDIAQYLLVSEQTPSAAALGVLVAPDGSVRASGGLIVQLFPGAEEEILVRLEKSISRLTPVSTLVASGLTPEEIVAEAVGGLKVRYLERVSVRFKCRCSHERVGDILVAMGTQEIQKILQEQGQAEVRCHFCGRTHIFTASELEDILKTASQGS
jgi:molecular chaperone Hsp33